MNKTISITFLFALTISTILTSAYAEDTDPLITDEGGANIQGDTIYSIGTGDTIDLKPLNLWRDEAYAQYIYTDSELENIDTIFAIAIYKHNTGFEGSGKALSYNNCKIRLNNTSDDEFEILSSTGSFNIGNRDTTGTICFEGTIDVPDTNGWIWILFETPFVKTPGQNVSVLLQHATNEIDDHNDAKWRHSISDKNRSISGDADEFGIITNIVLDIKFAVSLKTETGIIPNFNQKTIINNIQHYPNPVTNKITINFSLPVSQMVSLNVLNFNGKTVYTTGKRQMNTGLNQFQIDCKNLVPGTYFYILKTSKESFRNKLIVIQR